MLGIPDRSRGCLFDLDGVLTQTATVHAAAWQQMFDGFLRQQAQRTGGQFVPFDPVADYDKYVDGKSRADGTRSFLQARGIELPEGSDSDPPGTATIAGLGSLKNQIVLRKIADGGVQVYPGSGVAAPGGSGLRRAQEPAPADSYLHAAAVLGLEPAGAVVYEDALAGVAAGRAGHFGFVVGVDRAGQAGALREAGADVVVRDLAELLDER